MQLIINGVKIRLHSNIYKCASLHHKRRNRRSPQLLNLLSLLVYTLIKRDKSSNRQQSVWRAAECSTNRTWSFDNWGEGSKHLGNLSLISSPKRRTRTLHEHAWGHVQSEECFFFPATDSENLKNPNQTWVASTGWFEGVDQLIRRVGGGSGETVIHQGGS